MILTNHISTFPSDYKRVLWMLFSVGFVALFFIGKGDAVIALNNLHSPGLDYFFKHFTYLGDGVMFAVLLVIMLFYRYYYALVLFGIILIQTIVVQGAKRLVFQDQFRPKPFLENLGYDALQFVEGVQVHAFHSFPSGHTATAFSIAAFIALITANKWIGYVALITAVLVGMSRIYLVLHFYIDVYAGALVGVGSVLFTVFIFRNFLGLLQEKKWANRSLLN